MRLMFSSSAGTGHVLPMLPLARACMRRGHDVAWASSSDAFPALGGLGIDLWDAGASAQACRKEYRERWPEYASLRGPALAAHTFPKQFGGVAAPHMIDGLTRAIESWKPDIVVNEVAALAAPLVCRRLGIPNVAHAFGLMVPLHRLELAAREFAPSWAAAGWDVPPDCGLFRHLYIDIAPPSLQSAEAQVLEHVQLSSPNAARAAPVGPLPAAIAAGMARSPSRPVIYLTFGTVRNRSPLLKTTTAALARLNATIIVTLGHDGDARLLDPLPDNVHVLAFVPQNELLPICDAVVSHGGAGTTLAALSYGLPQLLLPQAADQFRNAAACTAAGAALSLCDAQAEADAIERAATRLLESGSLTDSAQRIASEIFAMPSVDDVAYRLESMR